MSILFASIVLISSAVLVYQNREDAVRDKAVQKACVKTTTSKDTTPRG